MVELRQRVRRLLQAARRAMVWETMRLAFATSLLIGLPVAAASVAVSERWASGGWTVHSVGILVTLLVLCPSIRGLIECRSLFQTARRVDARANLKGRLASAVQFLEADSLDAPRRAQVDNALARASDLEYASLFDRRIKRWPVVVPCLIALFAASFFVPHRPAVSAVPVESGPRRIHQLAEITELQEELEKLAANDEDLSKVLEQLKEIAADFRTGKTEERDMMIQLSRLDKSLARKMDELGAQLAVDEIDQVMPFLKEVEAMKGVHDALSAQAFDQAAQEMEKLGAQVATSQESPEIIDGIVRDMKASLTTQDEESANSLLQDFLAALNALNTLDIPGFGEKADAIATKFRLFDKLQDLEAMKAKMGMAQDSIGLDLAVCPVCNGKGCPACKQPGVQGMRGKGENPTTDFGNGILGVAFSNRSRLEEAYRELFEVSGVAGEGPIKTTLAGAGAESIDGEVSVMEVFAEYAEVAEQAIEKESLPLRHRFHIKRYFQAIHPQEP